VSAAETAALSAFEAGFSLDFGLGGTRSAVHEIEAQKPGSTAENLDNVSGGAAALVAAAALVDAVFFVKKGTDAERAMALVEEVFERQRLFGFQGWGPESDELLFGAAEDWTAAMAAVLLVAKLRSLTGMFETASSWWRRQLEVWEAAAEKATLGEDAEGILFWIQKAGPLKSPTLSTRLFYRMPDVPLRRKEGEEWRLPKPFMSFSYISQEEKLANVQKLIRAKPLSRLRVSALKPREVK
jgi:hypothetical protein